MAKNRTVFFCQNCGYESAKWMGQCPACRQWNTFVEEPVTKTASGRQTSRTASKQPSKLSGIQTEKEERIWDVLCSPYNQNYQAFDMLCSVAVFQTSKPDADCEATIREYVYGCHGEEAFTSWGDVMCLDREKVKDILFVWPYHTIYDFCSFAMTDLFKIKKFHLEIELTDEIL